MTFLAAVDVEVTIGFDGFFEHCNIKIERCGHNGDVWVTYRIVAGDMGAAICHGKGIFPAAGIQPWACSMH